MNSFRVVVRAALAAAATLLVVPTLAVAITIEHVDLPADAMAPASVVTGPDEKIWILERDLQNAPQIRRVDAATGETVSTMSLQGQQVHDRAFGLATGADGWVYILSHASESGEPSFVGRMSSEGVIETLLARPAGRAFAFVAGAPGDVWTLGNRATGVGNAITRVSVSGQRDIYDLDGNLGVGGIAPSGPDRLWFARERSEVGLLDKSDGGVELFDASEGIRSSPDIHTVAAAANGDLLLTYTELPLLARVTPEGVVTEYPLPVIPAKLVATHDGIWFTWSGSSGWGIGRLAGATVTLRPTTDCMGGGGSWTLGPGGHLWLSLAEEENGRLVRISDLDELDSLTCSGVDPVSPPPPEPAPACFDGVDNDGDGAIDFPNDPGCESASDQSEVDPPTQPGGGDDPGNNDPGSNDPGNNNPGGNGTPPGTGPGPGGPPAGAATVPPSIDQCVTIAPPAAASSISHPVRLGRGALVRFKGPRRGLVVRSTDKTYKFQFKLKGKAATRIRSVQFALDGRLHQTVKPKRSLTLPFANRALQSLAPGRHAMTASLKLRKAVKVKGKKGKRRSLKIRSAFVVRNCAPPSVAVVQTRKRLRRPTGIAMRASSGGPTLSGAEFRVGSALKFNRQARKWARKTIGSITLRAGSRTAFKAALKAPRKVRKTMRFTLSNGVTLSWKRNGVSVAGLPDGVNGVWLRLDGTRKQMAFRNPSRKRTTKHSVRLTDRQGKAVTVNRTTRISARSGKAK